MTAADEGDALRRTAALHAMRWVTDGMVLGFGTGRAAGHALQALADRAKEGLRISGVPSSRATEERARALGLPLTSLDEHPQLDLTLDGADEVSPERYLIKGGGGALLREKVLAAASRRLVILVERSKLVSRLGETRGIPLEVLPFAGGACLRHLRDLGGTPDVRRDANGDPRLSDNGNWLIDCTFSAARMAEPVSLDRALRSIPGILETGLFCGFDPAVVVGEPSGARVLGEPPS